MAHFYTEPVKREPNNRGRPRLVSILAGLPGAIHHGFDGDGTPPKRGGEAGHTRLWEFPTALSAPLPDGVVELAKMQFDQAIADREAARPITPSPDNTRAEAHARAVASIIKHRNTATTLTPTWGRIFYDLAVADGLIEGDIDMFGIG